MEHLAAARGEQSAPGPDGVSLAELFGQRKNSTAEGLRDELDGCSNSSRMCY